MSQSQSQSDNIEINSSNAPNLSRNFEDSNDNEVEEISLSTLKDKKGKKVSTAWDHFTKVTINGEKKAKCMHCNAFLEAKYTLGTTSLNRHVKSCFSRSQPKIQEALQGSLKVLKREDGSCDIGFDSFNPKVLRSLIARMVVMHELPLKFVEYKGFREMMAHTNPVVKPMSRNTLKSEISKLYHIEKIKTLHMLEKNQGRVAITTDLWIASNQKKGYMVVTAHFIDNSWKLHNRILRFIYVPSPHTAEALSNELVQCLLDWNVDRKLSSMTLDNCSTNDAMVEKLLLRFDLALMYKSVFSRLQQRESQYKSLPSDSECDLAATMVEHLKSFYMLTEMFSGTKYPTANLFFPLICKMKMSINGWRTSDNLAIRIMADKMVDKFEKYWNEIHPMLVVAVVLDPRYKMLLIDFYFPKIYGDTADEHIEHAHKLCHDLVKEYEMKAMVLSDRQDVGLDDVPLESSSNANKYWDVDEFEIFRSQNKRVKVTKSELDSRLNPNTLESLMCAQNWIWASSRGGVPENEIFAGEELISDDDDDDDGAQSSSCLT
ncbi:BED-type domain-containing protein [Citrus sinensis]|nr:BED-type domain-containing protein [Citrus sinensis]